MVSTAIERLEKSSAEIRNCFVSMVGKLDSGELLTGSPTVTQKSGTGTLTFANQAVNTSVLTINGKSVAVGQAVQFRVSGGTAGQQYTINIKVSTDATPSQTLEIDVILNVT